MTACLGTRYRPISGSLHVESYGPETAPNLLPTIVLCHGFGGSGRNFRPQARALRDQFRVVVYDARGHARSKGADFGTQEQSWSMSALVDDLGWVLDNFASEQVVLGGLSMGAATALTYTIEHPERVRGLMLAAYPNTGDKFRTWAIRFAAHIEQAGLESAFETYVGGESSRFDAKSRELIRQGFLEHSESALAFLLRFVLAQIAPISEMAESLSKLSMPTRIIVGGDDAGSLEPSEQLASLIPNATLSVLDGAGHVVNLERVPEFNNELRELISEAIR